MENSLLTVPQYYFENNYLDSRIETIRRRLDKYPNADVFILITDLHFSKNAQNSPALIRYIADRIDIGHLFVLGDTDEYGLTPKAPELLRKAFNGRISHALGGHDYMNGITDREIADILSHDHADVTGNPLRGYFYTDNPEKQARYIVINSYRSQNGNEKWKSVEAFESKQLSWLEQGLLSMPYGFHALIFTHALYSLDISHNRMLPIDSPGYSEVLRIITDHSDRIAAVFQGHAHRDRILKINGRVPLIVSAGDMNVPWVDPCGIANIEVDRANATIREQSFDVCIHDTASRSLTLIRIGGSAIDNGVECDERYILY